jgi:diguanylate cyclase (GGDEF)-like protein/PAS domain S-box-containing protein
MFSLPFIVIFVLLLTEIKGNTRATERRISGMEYENPLVQLLHDVLHYRNAANAALSISGNIEPSRALEPISSELTTIDNDIEAMDRVDRRLDPTLQTSRQWSRLKTEWARIKQRVLHLSPGDVKTLFDPHSGKLATLVYNPSPDAVSLISHSANVADASGLILETHLDSYYLVDVAIVRLPELANEIAAVSDVGQLILARGSQSITNEEIRELDLRVGTIKSSKYAIGRHIKAARSYNPALVHDFEAFAHDEATQKLLNTVETRFVDAIIIDLSPQEYYVTSQSALDAQFELYDTLSTDIDDLMTTELQGWQKEQRYIVIFAILVMLTTCSGFTFYYRSLTARLEAEESLRETEKRNRLIVDNALDAIIGMDGQGRIVDWNPQAEAIFGWSREEILGRTVAETIVPLRYREAHEQGLQRFKETGRGRVMGQQLEIEALHHDGHEFPIELKISLVEGGRKHLFSAFISDVTERKQIQDQLQRNAFFDGLTGLPNRNLFMDRLSSVVRRAKRDSAVCATVLFIDLDHFKVVNDSMGHTTGDELLVAVAQRLETCLREGDTVARLGGDEFTILLEDTQDFAAATHVAERVQQVLAAPFTLNNRPVFISASIGIAGGGCFAAGEVRPDDPEALLRDADIAMYRAKAQGRTGYAVFDKAMHEQAMARLHLEADLRQALDQQDFELHYQPIVRLADKRITGFEALVRWRHPANGLVAPGVFIPLAEETGLIIRLDQWVLREACRQLAVWTKDFTADPPLSLSVNLSGRHFGHPDLIENITRVLHETRIPPSTLKLEVTESAIIDNPQAAATLLHQLQMTGVQLSLDDFGTGYSSLSYLHRFPFNTLKIDRSFVKEMSNKDAGEIVRTIISLAHNLGLNVVAEGIETGDQEARLTALGCEYGQGFFLAKPLDKAATQSLLASTTPGHLLPR